MKSLEIGMALALRGTRSNGVFGVVDSITLQLSLGLLAALALRGTRRNVVFSMIESISFR
jgi:hypothetical protein